MVYEYSDYRRTTYKLDLDNRIKTCKLCPGLNIKRVTESAPGYGDIFSPVMIIGQSLCSTCMKTQIPFTEGSGVILDVIFKKLGIAKRHLFTTNLVHCHPAGNRPSKPKEIQNCMPFLVEETLVVNPILIVGLGRDVKDHLSPNVPFNQVMYHANGPKKGRHVVFFYHPAYFYRRSGVKGEETKEYIELVCSVLRRWV